jgi:hypothetical protein
VNYNPSSAMLANSLIAQMEIVFLGGYSPFALAAKFEGGKSDGLKG